MPSQFQSITAKVVYNGNLRTTITHVRSGNSAITDAPIDNNGNGEAFSPTDLVATALASCMLTVMGIKANELGIEFMNAEANVIKQMGSNPRRIKGVEVQLFLPATYTDKQKSILENTALNCPVAKSLHADLEQSVQFNYR